MDENKHPSFVIWHFMDEHLCLFVWMKKSTPGFSFFILWTSICALFYGWKNATQLLILHFMKWTSVPDFMDGKQPSFSFCILWMSICTHFLDENSPTSYFILHFTDEHLYLILWMKKNPTRFLILHFMDECLDVFVGWKQANRLFHFAFNGWVSRYLILWMEHISCSLHLWISITQAPIVCLHSDTYFMDEQANQLSLYL
jgi:hypothetical protein